MILRDMVEAAMLAPSAENLQPWRFAVEADRLIVAEDRQRRLPSDADGMLALTGIGAAIENAVLACREHHLEPVVSLLDEHDPADAMGPVPTASLEPLAAGTRDPLADGLRGRCATRRMRATSIAADLLARIGSSIEQFEDMRLDWLTDPREIRPVAKLVGLGNRLRFETREFHAEFYENLRFTPEDALATRDGLDVRTLQLPPGVAAILHFLRRWPRMRLANLAGFSRSVARQAASEVRSSGAIGLLTVPAARQDAFVTGGRALERLWLATTREGLGFHPTASLPVFLGHARRRDAHALSAAHRPLVEDMARQYAAALPQLRGRVLQMAFRVGHAEPPPVRSVRYAAPGVMLPSGAGD